VTLEHTWPAWGLDEAGRGPILGPMTVALVSLDEPGASTLRALGVQDSKRFGSGAKAQQLRAELCVEIRRVAVACVCVEIQADVIDEHTYRGQLNVLEQRTALQLLVAAGTAEDAHIVADGARIFSCLKSQFRNLVAVDKGESAHICVAAASIIAKHARDEAFAVIAGRYSSAFGPISGGGYLNAATRRFLTQYEKVHGGLPPEARKSWGAAKIEDDEPEQISLVPPDPKPERPRQRART
jgi:ribonuclease HII